MVEHALIGTWKVIGSSLNSQERWNDGCTAVEDDLKGVRFSLGKNGDVLWVVSEKLKSVPLFQCDTYEYHFRTGGFKIGSLVDLKFGAYAGLIFKFEVLVIDPKKQIVLQQEEMFDLNCIHLEDPFDLYIYDSPFSLLPALEEGYFSDRSLSTSNNKKFQAHSIFLQMLAHDIDWLSDPPPFDGKSEEVLGTILHFLYSECLPENLTEKTAIQVITEASKYPSLKRLVDLCELYNKRMQLKNQILSLVNEMHICMDRIVEYINPCPSKFSIKENLGSNPSKLCHAIKQSFKEEVVAIAKFVLLCDIFTKNLDNLKSFEQDEIMLLLKSRVPLYTNQFKKFLEGLKRIYRDMSRTQKVEMASFIVPELEVSINTILIFLEMMENPMRQTIQTFESASASSATAKSAENKMSFHLKRIAQKTESSNLVYTHKNIIHMLECLGDKKKEFLSMTVPEQIQVIAHNLEFFINEVPIFLIRLDEIVEVFGDDKLHLLDFKFFFKTETSKIAYILETIRKNVGYWQDGMLHVCELIQKDSFSNTLSELGLIESVPDSTRKKNETEDEKNDSRNHQDHSDRNERYKINLAKSLCIPPRPYQSEVSKKCLDLLNSESGSDMVFEVTYTGDSTTHSDVHHLDGLCERIVIKAHRVIVAARCDWFRRALQSGMREDIDKRILIPDTKPTLFRLFLEYLYGGVLDGLLLSSDTLLELLLLSDRYEMDSLKQVCECYLKHRVDTEMALDFLSIADQYNAHILKAKCINFISKHRSEIIETEEFHELPISLQTEVFGKIWTDPKLSGPSAHFYYEEEEAGECLKVVWPDNDVSENSEKRLADCISQLRGIIGETPTRSLLVQLILAADYNLQRAVNFYYADSKS